MLCSSFCNLLTLNVQNHFEILLELSQTNKKNKCHIKYILCPFAGKTCRDARGEQATLPAPVAQEEDNDDEVTLVTEEADTALPVYPRTPSPPTNTEFDPVVPQSTPVRSRTSPVRSPSPVLPATTAAGHASTAHHTIRS